MAPWNSLNLAPIKYAHVHVDHGGPILSISARESVRLGEKVFEAFATIKRNLMAGSREPSSLYGNSDGSGTGPTRSEAIYRAISESLERWAWHQSLTEQRPSLRFDLDATTTGFAAFPGISARSARKNAYLEAIERWSIGAWWEEKIGHHKIEINQSNVGGVEILGPFTGGTTAILWSDFPGFRAYGFASGRTLIKAIQKARVELGRNIQVLEYQEANRYIAPSTANEIRLVYFASAAGKARFDARLNSPAPAIIQAPALVVDCAVPGPWTQYTHVWRCLFDPIALCDKGEVDYFHF